MSGGGPTDPPPPFPWEILNIPPPIPRRSSLYKLATPFYPSRQSWIRHSLKLVPTPNKTTKHFSGSDDN